MAVNHHPTFLEAALSVAALERVEETWDFLRYCEVLPPDAKSDFTFVRAHEITRNEPGLPFRIAQSLADRALPKGLKPDPKSARAKQLWKTWADNNFKTPQYVPLWMNHSGTPTKKIDTFPSVPAQIGEVLSATTNVHDGRVDRDHSASIIFGVVVGGAPGALLSFIAAQIADWPAVEFTTVITVVASVVAYAVHLARNSRPRATWVGSEGLASTTDGKVTVFRFELATQLRRKVTDVVSNGTVTSQQVDCIWLNAKSRIVYRVRAVIPTDAANLPDTAAAHFVRAAEAAWVAFENKADP